MRRLVLKKTVFFLLLAAGAAFLAVCDRTPLNPINASPDGVAIKGYDPVAYFLWSMPQKGDESWEYEWNGAKWRFSSQENLARFRADPEKYAPRFGGY